MCNNAYLSAFLRHEDRVQIFSAMCNQEAKLMWYRRNECRVHRARVTSTSPRDRDPSRRIEAHDMGTMRDKPNTSNTCITEPHQGQERNAAHTT